MKFLTHTLPCLLAWGMMSTLSAQAQVTLTGQVTDASGALIPGAVITVHVHGKAAVTTKSGDTGNYALTSAAGTGTLDASAPGFAPFVDPGLVLTAGRPRTLNIKLMVATTEQVEVTPETSDAADPNNNGDQVVLRARDLDLLPTDQTQLQQQLQALSGGDAPELYVNGFSGGTLPPKDTIREIRINQNPYSALNDTNPVNGRIDILTKPGTGAVHGDIFVEGNDSSFNSANPFAPNAPPYYSFSTFSNVSGPINKNSSYFFTFNRQSYEGNSIIRAQTVAPVTFAAVDVAESVAAPNSFTGFSARYDLALGKSSTVIARYELRRTNQTDGGVGQLTLAEAGFNSNSTVQTLELSNSQIVSPKIVNDTRFQYIRTRSQTNPLSTAPAILVQGAFNGGGSAGGASRDNLDRYELQNYANASEGKQYLTFGVRLRVFRDANVSRANYNGLYTFASLASYQATLEGVAGAGPSEFILGAGMAGVSVALADVGGFLQDDFKVRPNITLSAGFRFESQSGMANHADYAPRLALTWGLFAKKGKPTNYTLRAGSGVFYYRFGYGNLLTAERQNGVTQQQFIVQNPTFFRLDSTGQPTVPSASTLSAQAPSSITQVSPTYHAPYFIADTIAMERRLGAHGTLTASYVNTRGVHTALQRNVNAPMADGTRPLGGTENVYQFQSEGVQSTNRFSVNLNVHTKRFFVYSFYQMLSNKTDTDGGFPSNSYDLGADYGRSNNDTHRRFAFGSSLPLPYGFSSYVNIYASSGSPFNITLGNDLNGDSQYNDRPTFATDLTRPSVVSTRWGVFDTAPIAGQQTIPRNFGSSPAFIGTFLSLDRSFQFGPVIPLPAGQTTPKLEPGAKSQPPDRRYSIHFSVNMDNVLNHVNYAQPVGVLPVAQTGLTPAQQLALPSNLFGKSTSLANGNNSGNRQVSLQTYFRF